MKTIAIANQKGGTGKTTTTYNLGIALTQQGYRVLMVDFDPQGNLSCYCGIPPEKDLDQTITELLMKTSCEKPIGNRECVYQTGRKEATARVDFIPSNLRLAGFELAMGTMMCREVLLKSCLPNQPNPYLNRYARLRLEYLEQNEPTLCDQLMLEGTLLTSCSRIGRTAQQMVDKTLRELMQATPMPDRRTNPLGWAQLTNSLKKQAEEAVLPMLYEI